jgi:SAM-dependent methyltransferase
VVKYHGLARRYRSRAGFLMRPLTNGGTLGAPAMLALTREEASYFDDEQAQHESKYLNGPDARAQSGFGRDEGDWRRYREVVLAPVVQDGTFLDIGCANGLLMESVVAWAAERGRRLEPFGLEISARLAALARQRLPHWHDRIFVGNALDWQPPCKFDYVRTELVYVPRTLRLNLVSHLFANVVAPRGRLIVVSYGSSRPEGPRAETLVDEFRDWPFDIVRVDDSQNEPHSFVVTRVVTLAVKEGLPTSR